MELGETAFDAMRRELWEETGATFGQAELIGYEKLMIHAPMPIPYAYPYPVSYLVFYWGRMNRQTALEANEETRGTGFFRLPKRAPSLASSIMPSFLKLLLTETR